MIIHSMYPISYGVVEIEGSANGRTLDQTVELADAAMYECKRKNKKEILGVSEVLAILETPCFFVDGRKRCMEMIGIIIGGAAVVIAVSLYCCIRVGAEEDRRLEELDRRAKQDAEESG